MLALERELSGYGEFTRIPVRSVSEILNKVTNKKPRFVVLPENAREEALQLLKKKMRERTLSFSAEFGKAISRVPKDFSQWWEQDSDDPETRGMEMLARSYISDI